MKKKIAWILIIALLFTMVGCSKEKEVEGTKIAVEPDDTDIVTEVLWLFYAFCKIPHTSGHERKLSQDIEFRLNQMGYTCVRDETNNVIAEIPATKGYEKAPLTILQAHLDMVTTDTELDAVKMRSKPIMTGGTNEKISSDGKTALGADNGIGIAAMLYYISRPEYIHGPIRLILTSNGENDMSGAKAIDSMYVENAKYLISLDGYQANDIVAGSASVRRETYTRPSVMVKNNKERALRVDVTGFEGGSEGNDMWRKRANALKIMAEIFARAEAKGIDFDIATWKGGGSENSIPEESAAIVALSKQSSPDFEKIIYEVMYEVEDKYKKTDPNGTVKYAATDIPKNVIEDNLKKDLIVLTNGMTDGIIGKAEGNQFAASANFEKVSIKSTEIKLIESIRSTSDADQAEVIAQHSSVNEKAKFKIEVEETAGWQMDARHNRLIQIMVDAYKRKIGATAKLVSSNGNIEVPIFIEKNPKINAVAIGPTIVNAHTKQEYVLSSTIGPFVRTMASALRDIAHESEEQ